MEIRKNLKSAAYMFGGEIFIKTVLFLSNAVVARLLGVSTYGEFSNIFSITASISFLADFGSSTVITRDIASRKKSPSEILTLYTKAKVNLSIVILALTTVVGYLFDRDNMLLYVLLGAYNIIQNGILLFYYAILRGGKLFKEESLTKGLNLLGMILGLSIFIYASSKVSASLVYLASAVIPAIFLYSYLNRKYLPSRQALWRVRNSWKGFASHWKIGVGNFFEGLTQIVPIIAINTLSGSYSLGLFSAAYRLISPFLLLSAIANNFVMPYIAENAGKIQLTNRKKFIGIGIITLYLAISFVISELLINLIYGSEYLDSLPFFRILILLPIFDLFALIQMTQLASKEREKTYLLSSIINVFITAVTIILMLNLVEDSTLAVTISIVLNRLFAILLRILMNKVYDRKYENNNI